MSIPRIVFFIVAKETWYTGSKTERILEVVHQARKLIGWFLKKLDLFSLDGQWEKRNQAKGKKSIGASDYDVLIG